MKLITVCVDTSPGLRIFCQKELNDMFILNYIFHHILAPIKKYILAESYSTFKMRPGRNNGNSEILNLGFTTSDENVQ
jgi:hypothetical protein